jgi:hypothetical protein
MYAFRAHIDGRIYAFVSRFVGRIGDVSSLAFTASTRYTLAVAAASISSLEKRSCGLRARSSAG